MKNGALKWLFVVIVGCLVGCYNPQRDLSIDPYNRPIIHVLNAAYEPAGGVALVQWEYLGEKPVASFVLQRRDEALFRNLERASGTDANSLYAFGGTFRDGDLFAGEHLQYRVIAEHSEGGSIRTAAAEVTIPGAGLRELRRDPVGLRVQLLWDGGGDDVHRYEVVKAAIGREPETIFATDDPLQNTFWDHAILDNNPHRYWVRSHLPNNVQLRSRSVNIQFYTNVGRHLVETLRPSDRMRLAAADLDGTADLMALIGRDNQVSLSRLRHSISVGLDGTARISRRLIGVSFPQIGNLKPESLDLAGPPLVGPRAVFPRAYIGGIDNQGRVVVIGLNLVQNTIVWQLPDNAWSGVSGNVRLAHDDQRRVYVTAGGTLRVYSSAGFESGNIDMSHGTLVDLAVQDNIIWALWQDKVSRGEIELIGDRPVSITWRDIMPVADSGALTLNGIGQVFVLNGNQIRMFDPDGQAMISWTAPSGTFAGSDLAIGSSALKFLHLSDQNGEVITYVP